MSGKWTKGPWAYDAEGDYIWTASNGQESPDLIAEVRGIGANLPIEANAKLIAASPAMAELLRLGVQAIRHADSRDHEATQFCDACMDLQRFKIDSERLLAEIEGE